MPPIKLKELSPEQRLKHAPVYVEREDGWVVMDKLGTTFLATDDWTTKPQSLYITNLPYHWANRRKAREAYAVWRGEPLRPGRPKTNPDRPPDNNDRIRFERLFGCLMYLWKCHPSAVTLDSVQRHVQKLMKREFHQRAFRRDMANLVKYGYCTKNGPTYTAVPEFRRWWSDEFEDAPTPRSSNAQ